MKLFTAGHFNFRLHHLLLITVLVISFSISFMVRSQAADYGFELNEFDPFFNFRATQFIVDNGFEEYFNWNDDKSWFPHGRDVSNTSQVMLHITAASLYQIFGVGFDLYDFTIILPVVFGSLTTIVVFGLVRVIAGTSAGLFASLLFSLSVPVIVRGTIGWFKSEPLGLFYGLLAIYFLLSGIHTNKGKISFVKLIAGGLFFTFGLASWGGIQFFIIPLSIFFLILPFLRKDHKFLLWAIPVFVGTLIFTALLFERPGITFVAGHGGFLVIGPTLFLVGCIFIQKMSKEEKRLRNGLAFLGGTILAGVTALAVSAISLPSFRYLNAINPFLTTQDPLVDSVAEHATTTTAQSFYFLSILMIFSGIGIWLIFRSRSMQESTKLRTDMTSFALIIGLIGVYTSSAFVRLELFASISVIILSAIGLSLLTTEMFRNRKLEGKKFTRSPRVVTKISFFAVIIGLLLVPVILPENGNWVMGVKAPPTLLNGGTNYAIATDDWPAATEWLKNNTPENSVIASWWDYGYWITTLSGRTSLADNATLVDWQIAKIGEMLLSNPDRAWQLLQEMGADYVLIYGVGQKINAASDPQPLYLLGGGGDESKKQWFMRISGNDLSKFLESDGFSGTEYFWENTLLGKMLPFSLIIYANLETNEQSQVYVPGYTAVYVKDIKYPTDGDGPLKFAYASPSFYRDSAGVVSGVFIYEVNKDYKPNLEQLAIEPTDLQIDSEIAVITTGFGDITIQFNEDIAPQTVENFKKLAESGFYDGTIFHRIIPGFIIQGGDPNTILGERETWGTGDPGYTIAPEFSEIKHERFIVSMARGADVNSAGSQFFIVLDDSPWLDGKYTIFGEVISGKDVVEKIAVLETNNEDQPVEKEKATIENIVILKP